MNDQLPDPNNNLIEQLFSAPYVELPNVSPDRNWVVWSWFNLNSKVDLYITSLKDPTFTPKKITDFQQNTMTISWTTDSQNIVVAHDKDGDEKIRLYKIDINSYEITPLTEPNPKYYIRGGQLDSDQKNLILAINYDFENNTETDITYVYKLNLETNVYTKLASPKNPAFIWPVLNSDGTHIMYQRQDISPFGQQIWLTDIDGKEDKEIINEGTDKEVRATWHPNGQDIIFIAEADDYKKVGLYNIKTQTKRWLLDDPSRNIESAYITYGSEQAVLLETKSAELTSFLLDLKTLNISPLTTLPNVTPLAPINSTKWLSLYTNSKQPNDLAIHDLNGIQKNITNSLQHAGLDSEKLVLAENYKWLAKDGLQIQGWLYKTTKKPEGTVIYIHGGPTDHSTNNWDATIQYLVSVGFNVLAPNYRGSTGFGLKFQDSIKKDGWGGAEQQDIIDGIKSLIKDKIATPGRIGVMGTSFGGYSAWYLITHYKPEYVTAAVPICGMIDLKKDYEATRPDLRNYSISMMGGSPEDIPDKYRERSPINFVENIQGQIFIVQGLNDPNVTMEQVNIAENILKKHKIKYQKLIFKDEGHGIYEPANVKKLLKETEKFFTKAFAQEK